MAARPSVQLPTGSSGSRGYRGGGTKCKPAACGRGALPFTRCRKLNLIRSAHTKHVADFPQLLPLRNSQISPHLLYRTCKQETDEQKEGDMRVRVATDGRLLGLDTG